MRQSHSLAELEGIETSAELLEEVAGGLLTPGAKGPHLTLAALLNDGNAREIMDDVKTKVQALKEAIEADGAFKDELAEAMHAGDVEKAIRLAADKGIEFTPEELASIVISDSEGRELDDAELDAVAGGRGWDEGNTSMIIIL